MCIWPIHFDFEFEFKPQVQRIMDHFFVDFEVIVLFSSRHTDTTMPLPPQNMGLQILRKFYRSTIESITAGCITDWYGNCLASDRKALQRVVRKAQYITGAELIANPLPLYQAVSEVGSKNGQRLQLPYTVLSATAQEAVPMYQVWNQQVREQLLHPSY